MSTFPAKSTLSPPITRHFEFTRIHNHLIASAYQSLVPVISRHPERPRSRADGNDMKAMIQGLRSKAEGV